MARPYLRPDEKPGGAVTLTSSRVDPFTDSDQPAALAFHMVISFIDMVTLEAK